MRRETVWGDIGTVVSTLSGSPSAVLTNSLGAGALAQRPFTIIRTRGVMHVRSDQVIASETYIGDLGLAIVSDQAIAIGVSAVPTPLTDKGSDLWFVYEQLIGHFQFGDLTGFNTGGVSKEIDSKGMRRVEEGSDLAVVVENEIAGCILTFTGRLLVKLH